MSLLSILIPSRNEQYLQKTIEDINLHKEGDTEILWKEDYGIGQRALTNELAKLSTAKYIMKVDAHCSFSPGFDVEMIKAMDDNTIMAPYLLKLDAEKWKPLPHLPSSSFCFDTNLVFQYDRAKENPNELIVETMSLQGSAWMMTRENYFKWNVDDPTLGSWGKQGTVLGIKAWLNGGVCKVNKNCFYSHLFRENEEAFPYQRNKEEIRTTADEVIKRFKNKSIEGLIRKFGLPANWTEELVANLPE